MIGELSGYPKSNMRQSLIERVFGDLVNKFMILDKKEGFDGKPEIFFDNIMIVTVMSFKRKRQKPQELMDDSRIRSCRIEPASDVTIS